MRRVPLFSSIALRVARHNQGTIRGARECGNAALDLAGVAHTDRGQLDPERGSCQLDCAQLTDP
jgi:hypothetical protein